MVAAAEAAAAEGITLLGVSNYYDFSVYLPFAQACLERGIAPLFGLEVIAFDSDLATRQVRANDPANPGKVYLCGKGMHCFETRTARAEELLGLIRSRDELRIAEMLELALKHLKTLGVEAELDAGSIKQNLASRLGMPAEWVVLQERHLVQALFTCLREHPTGSKAFEKLLTGWDPTWSDVKMQDALRSAMLKKGKPAYVPEGFISIEQAVELIRELGGEPVYPVLGDAVPGLTELERDPHSLFDVLESWDIRRLEWIPTRNTQEYLSVHVMMAVERGWGVTAGTEHNTASMEPVLPSCRSGFPVPEMLQVHFVRGLLELLGIQMLGLIEKGAGPLHKGDGGVAMNNLSYGVAVWQHLRKNAG